MAWLAAASGLMLLPHLLLRSVRLILSRDGSSSEVPEVLSACVVTRAMSKAEPGLSDGELGDDDFEAPSLSDFPLSVSQSELR